MDTTTIEDGKARESTTDETTTTTQDVSQPEPPTEPTSGGKGGKKVKEPKPPKPEKEGEVSGVLRVNPDSLIIASDKGHPLYDERQNYPLDPEKLAWNRVNGAKGRVALALKGKGKDEGLYLIDGRQTTAHLREVNRERATQGLPPFLMEVRVLHGVSLDDAADLMEVHNAFRVTDSLIVTARKMLRRYDRLKSKALADGVEFNEKEVIESTARVFNVSDQTVRQRLVALEASKEAQDAFESGHIRFGDLVEIARGANKEAQDEMLKKFKAERVGTSDPTATPPAAGAGPGAPAAPNRKRKAKGLGKKQLRKIVEDAPGLSAELQTFGRLILGLITPDVAIKEIPALKGYVRIGKAKTPKAPKAGKK